MKCDAGLEGGPSAGGNGGNPLCGVPGTMIPTVAQVGPWSSYFTDSWCQGLSQVTCL